LAAQSLISLHLLNSFPEDKIVGEEDTTELRQNDGLRSKVVELVNEGFGKGRAEAGAWSEGKTFSESEYVRARPLNAALHSLLKRVLPYICQNSLSYRCWIRRWWWYRQTLDD
jgi:3'-phosphoadenosine 5'-phosphosulfate (PAPS) 3'-phosphatase